MFISAYQKVKYYIIRYISEVFYSNFSMFFPPPMPPHVLMNFRGFPSGCGDSVADFWGWDAHEARLLCPDDMSGDMQEDEIPGGTW